VGTSPRLAETMVPKAVNDLPDLVVRAALMWPFLQNIADRRNLARRDHRLRLANLQVQQAHRLGPARRGCRGRFASALRAKTSFRTSASRRLCSTVIAACRGQGGGKVSLFGAERAFPEAPHTKHAGDLESVFQRISRADF